MVAAVVIDPVISSRLLSDGEQKFTVNALHCEGFEVELRTKLHFSGPKQLRFC